MLEGINIVLANNNAELLMVINAVKSEEASKEQLVLYLSMIFASNKTLEIMTTPWQPEPEHTLINIGTTGPPEQEPKPAFVADVESDDPEKEDKDLKKAREESMGFFG